MGHQIKITPQSNFNLVVWEILKIARTHFERNAAGVSQNPKPLGRRGVRGGMPAPPSLEKSLRRQLQKQIQVNKYLKHWKNLVVSSMLRTVKIESIEDLGRRILKMKKSLQNKLIRVAKKYQTKDDPSHDFQHVLRVMNLAIEISKKENADMDIIIPAALFHDVIVYRKDTKKSKTESDESAEVASRILNNIKIYPEKKIEKVLICIRQCSFSKGIKPSLLEAKILQDADRIEATGAIAIMRTFSSGGQMKRPFYDPRDPFRKKSQPKSFATGLDLFYERLLVIEKQIHTSWAKKIAKRRTTFLKMFLTELEIELSESAILIR